MCSTVDGGFLSPSNGPLEFYFSTNRHSAGDGEFWWRLGWRLGVKAVGGGWGWRLLTEDGCEAWGVEG